MPGICSRLHLMERLSILTKMQQEAEAIVVAVGTSTRVAMVEAVEARRSESSWWQQQQRLQCKDPISQ